MAKRGRPRKLDDIKKSEVVAVLTAGFTRQMAADYVGCSVPTLLNTAARDYRFANQIRQAEMHHQLAQLQTIERAGRDKWQAAAWLLERRNPDSFARRRSDGLTHEDLRATAAFVAELAFRELPAGARERFWKRIESHINTFVQRRIDPARGPRRAQRKKQAEQLLNEQRVPAALLPEHGGAHALDDDSISFLNDAMPDIVAMKCDPKSQLLAEIRESFLRSGAQETLENKTPEPQAVENNSEFL